MTTTGKIVAVNGNMITVAFSGAVAQNEVGYALLGDRKLMAEIVRVRGTRCDMQVFDSTTDLMVDGEVPPDERGNLFFEFATPMTCSIDSSEAQILQTIVRHYTTWTCEEVQETIRGQT